MRKGLTCWLAGDIPHGSAHQAADAAQGGEQNPFIPHVLQDVGKHPATAALLNISILVQL
ncbi:hypothetical protein LDL32_08340 [Komagataeibacter sp. FNDCF1]|nr:hypothetical protein [Komagataeibacter sp. FNDCF1]MCE2564664.1 hypothetical protein [Komagataeibacter sp. FNDCF1]